MTANQIYILIWSLLGVIMGSYFVINRKKISEGVVSRRRRPIGPVGRAVQSPIGQGIGGAIFVLGGIGAAIAVLTGAIR
ncbi:MAG: hypothetical protein KF761_09175 [Salinibacterium sp.]|nr:hypothetical protein [Salinibacterium sp.]